MPIQNDEHTNYILSDLLETLFFAKAITDYDWVELVVGEYDVYHGALSFDAKDLRGLSGINNVTVHRVELIFGVNGGGFIGYRFYVNGIDEDEIRELWKEVKEKRHDF